MTTQWGEYSCKTCGRCCHQDIPLTIYDIHRIARELGMPDREVFQKSVAKKTAPRVNTFAMKKKKDGSCVFLGEDSKCTIHGFKPRVCSFYPCPDILEKDKHLWERLYLSSSSFRIFWEHSMAENHTKRYIRRFGTRWNEDGYIEILQDIERCVVTDDGETLLVASDETGLPIMMKYNCARCKVRECRMETEITLMDISRIADNTRTSIQNVFKKAVSNQPHSHTGGLKLRKAGAGARCVYFDEKTHCKIYQFRPKFCQFEPCGVKVSDEETWKRFFFAAGDIDSQWELEIGAAVTRRYVKDVGTRYNRMAFENYVKEMNSLMKNGEVKDMFVRSINGYRYDKMPIQPAVHPAKAR